MNERAIMQIHELAKTLGWTADAVADRLGIEKTTGFHLKRVDDEKVKELAGYVPQRLKTTARFWSRYREHLLPAPSGSQRGDIAFSDWIYETDADSAEAAYLRSDVVRDKTGVREVLDAPYDDHNSAMEFMAFLRDLIYTGSNRAEGPSRSGLQSVRAMLRPLEQKGVSISVSDPGAAQQLIKIVAGSKSMNVAQFGTEV